MNVSAFFFLRTMYWLDFVLEYPDEIYFYLELFPYFWLITICSLLSFSWLKVAWLFVHEVPQTRIKCLGGAVGALNALMYTTFTLMYFVNWYFHRNMVMLVARIQNNAWLTICIGFLAYSGVKLSNIVGVYLSPEYRKKIRMMMAIALACLVTRLIINIALLVLSHKLASWKKTDGGKYHTIFSVLDYLVTEVAFLFFLAYAIQVPIKDKGTVASENDSIFSDDLVFADERRRRDSN